MEKFEWNINYATGIREIDSQHAYLFALTNRLIRHTDHMESLVSLESIIAELYDYVDRHFSYEESIMEQAEFAHIENHKRHHRFLRETLDSHAEQFKNGALTVGELSNFLKSWLKLHILREDMQYVPAVAKLNVD